MSLLFYRRPNYVEKLPGPLNAAEWQAYIERSRAAIPNELCFDYVVTNRALPPCSLHDFMGYLLYVSHDAENLQVFLWLQDYTKRFHELPESDQALSPPWDQAHVAPSPVKESNSKSPDKKLCYGFDKMFDIPLRSMPSSHIGGSVDNSFQPPETVAKQDNFKWQPFTIQPFRSEVDKIISHYLAAGSVRELNLSESDRAACLHALQHTTHPSAFAIPSAIVTETLRNQSHPNFIRWSMMNGNQPRIIFGRTLGVLTILFGFLISIMLTLSIKARWWRLFAALAWILGFNFLLAGANGICLVLYAARGRHLRPWEQFSSEQLTGEPAPSRGGDSDATTLAGTGTGTGTGTETETPSASTVNKGKPRRVALEAFGTANSYGHEVWVDKYRAKMMIRKVFDSTVWVENESVRILQDRVALQAFLWSIILTVPLTVMFTALPNGHYF